jgi:hypothetical protein
LKPGFPILAFISEMTAGWAPVVCWLQRQLSWKWEREPGLVGLAWPPYVLYDSADGSGHWRMIRAGLRYDRKWHGYIFPTAACKCVSKPLLY